MLPSGDIPKAKYCARLLKGFTPGFMLKPLSMRTPEFILQGYRLKESNTGKKNLIVNVSMHGGIA
jgi:hypothetical protein